MRLRRILAAAVITTLAAPTALLTTATEASAATATRITGTDGHSWIYRLSSYHTQPGTTVYGETLELDINVVDGGGNRVYDGTLTVQRQLPGQGWTTVKRSTSAYIYDSIKAVGNANYRVLYGGYGSTYAPSQAGVSSTVQRKIDITPHAGRHASLTGKVAPRYKGKVVVLKKHGKKWRKYKVVRTNRKSRFRVVLPAPRRGKYFWQVQVPGNRSFVTSRSGVYYTTKL